MFCHHSNKILEKITVPEIFILPAWLQSIPICVLKKRELRLRRIKGYS